MGKNRECNSDLEEEEKLYGHEKSYLDEDEEDEYDYSDEDNIIDPLR